MMPVTTLRIVESEPEASLHPRAIWNHWKKNVIWDPRSYYGVLEFNAVFILFYAFPQMTSRGGGEVTFPWSAYNKLASGILLGLGVSPLHWYSNHRQSTNLLTRSRTHFYVLLSLSVALFVSEIFQDPLYKDVIDRFIWFSIFILLVAAYVVYTVARNPRKDPILAELPSPTAIGIDFEDESQAAWASTTVADGIEDDSLEPEGQLRL